MRAELKEQGYRVEGELGRGGVGVVLRAVEVELGRPVAIKLLHATAPSPAQLERLRREGTILANLDHPGIVRVHRVGEVDGRPYLVSQLVEGARTLNEVWRTLALPQRVELVRQAAAAVGYAHGQGVVHRDLKPENVLVDAAGRARVIDFGLARLERTSRLTQTGQFVGTPYYMAPEQFTGTEPRPPTDVWALGVMLYEALAGQLPFQGDSFHALASAVRLAQPTPPRSVSAEVPKTLEAVCLRCLRPAPEDRYPHAEALVEALEEALEGRGPGASRAVGAAAGVLVLALVVGGVGAFASRPERVAAEATPEEGSAEARVSRASALLQAGDPEGALARLAGLPLNDPVPRLRLSALLQLRRLDEAAALGAQLERPSNEARRLRGLVALLRGEHEAAGEDLFGADRRALDLSRDASVLHADMQSAYEGGIFFDAELDATDLRRRVERLLTQADRVAEDWGQLARPLLELAQDAAGFALAVHVVAFSFQSVDEARALCRRNMALLEQGPSAERARLSLALSHVLHGYDQFVETLQMGLVREDPDLWSEPVVPELRYWAYAIWFLGDPRARLEAAAEAVEQMGESQMRGLHESGVARQVVYREWSKVLNQLAYEALRDGAADASERVAEAVRRGAEGGTPWGEDQVASNEFFHHAVALVLAGDLAAAAAVLDKGAHEQHRHLVEVEIALCQGQIESAAGLARRAVSREQGAPHAWAALAHVAHLDGETKVADQAIRRGLGLAERYPGHIYEIPWRDPQETLRILNDGSWWPGR
jgi:hypothetical protein